MFRVEVNTENAAFDDHPEMELARILRDLADRVQLNGLQGSYPIFDVNGNRIGYAKEE
jgi:hypothetical protein